MSILQHVERCLVNQQTHKALNAFISFANAQVLRQSAETVDTTKNGIAGRLIGIKDNICTKDGRPTTCASAILENYQSPYEATLVRKLRDAGALIVGKTNLDEFGMGSHSLNTANAVLGKCSSPERQVSAGGSSGGSAVAVATEQCWAAIGTDTGGSVRLPAAYNEVVGFKPSYGMISRFGVVAYANSLDTVGILANRASVARQVYDILSGPDLQDQTCLDAVSRESIQRRRSRQDSHQSLRIGIPREYNIAEVQPQIRNAWQQMAELLRKQGHTIHSVSLPTTQKALSAYYVLAPAEASSNLARYDGIRYGNPLYPGASYSATRGARLGQEVQKRILLGTFSLSSTAMDNYFIQAQKIRRLVQIEFNRAFRTRHPLLDVTEDSRDGVDVLLCPTAPTTPPLISALRARSAVEHYQDDVFTVPASLAGLPAINIPYKSGSQIGMQLIGQYGSDDLVLEAGEVLETCMRGE